MNTPIVSGYTDLEKIGSGGFAVVYRATQTAVGRQVALKLLHNAAADEDSAHRFRRECRVVGSLSWHPHIAAVLDAGSDDDGRSYLVFELLSGGSLGDRLKRDRRIPWADAVGFAIQTADALAAAHEQAVLHRDIKPDNILLDRLGRAKLADFGIAAMHDGTQTKTGVITATLAHAAPEVLNGERATKFSDIYLLGSTLFQLIAGEPPFGSGVGDTFYSVMQRIALQPAPTLVSIADLTVPSEVSAVVDRALRKQPHERFESAAAMGMALREIQGAHDLTRTSMPFAETQSHSPRLSTAAALDVGAPLPAPPGPPAVAVGGPLPATPATVASSPVWPSPAGQSIDVSTQPGRDRQRTKVVLFAMMALALVGAGVAAFVLSRSSGAAREIVAIEVKQTESAQGFSGMLAIDGDLATGWLSPTNPNGHEIVFGFGRMVSLEAVVIHSGPDPAGAPALSAARGLGPTVLEFSDGTEMTVELNESLPTQTIAIQRLTSSIGIRSI